MNLTIFVYVGPNTDATCMMRPIFFNLSSTLMFAPLVMKLRRVNMLVHNPHLKKIVIKDGQVLLQVLGLLFIDGLLLLPWAVFETPRMIIVSTGKYSGVYKTITDHVCSTGLDNYFEIIFILYKSGLIASGIYQAANAWNVTGDLLEAKYFAIAIYNITMLGGLSYFLSIYLLTNTGVVAAVILRCLGLSLRSVVAVLVIIFPKLFINENTVVPESQTGTGSGVNSNQWMLNNQSSGHISHLSRGNSKSLLNSSHGSHGFTMSVIKPKIPANLKFASVFTRRSDKNSPSGNANNISNISSIRPVQVYEVSNANDDVIQ